MKVFISWSGELSQRVALVLRDWLPSVIQNIQPYVSSEDIEKGTRWSTDISKELEVTHYGILIITKENLGAPWLNFEAGAISKSVDGSHVSPFLFDIKKSEVKGPLLQFQLTIFEKDDVYKLLRSINTSCDPPCIDDARLEKILNVWWPSLEDELNSVLKDFPNTKTSNSMSLEVPSGEHANMILEELLELVRNQQKILSNPDILLPPKYLYSIYRDLENFLTHEYHLDPEAIADLDRNFEILKSTIKEYEGEELIPLDIVKDRLDTLGKPLHYILRRLMIRPLSGIMARAAG